MQIVRWSSIRKGDYVACVAAAQPEKVIRVMSGTKDKVVVRTVNHDHVVLKTDMVARFSKGELK